MNALTQSVLMSISIARTAPAACSVRASASTDNEGPPAKMIAPSAVTPTPERHTYTLLPSVAPKSVVSFSRSAGLSCPLSTMSTRFWRTALMFGPIWKSRPHTPTVGMPSWSITSDAAPSCSGAIVTPSR